VEDTPDQAPPVEGAPEPQRAAESPAPPPVEGDGLTLGEFGMPQIEWVRRWDGKSGASYFQPVGDTSCTETSWTLPSVTWSGEWVPVWDEQSLCMLYVHTRTGEARFLPPHAKTQQLPTQLTTDIPSPLSPHNAVVPKRVSPHSVVLEFWDLTENRPYYLHCATGYSTWEEPTEASTIIVEGIAVEDGWWLQSVIEQASQLGPSARPGQSLDSPGLVTELDWGAGRELFPPE
jgi:hypothetical protein